MIAERWRLWFRREMPADLRQNSRDNFYYSSKLVQAIGEAEAREIAHAIEMLNLGWRLYSCEREKEAAHENA